ncbi:hypothetical protein FOPE_12143 [Fonsecaea pedrosoi]|nr:hypothetical protein FOPE_12143 [Fonsecaea pedrosoi]
MQASPSKARAQALASHSWSIVSGWLARLYHPSPVPAFERNAATLQALQSLMAENIAADRVRELLFEAKVEELEAAEEEEERRTMGIGSHHDAIAIMSLLETSLAPAATTALESLASSVVVLGRASPSTSASTRASVLGDLPSRIVNIPRQTFAQESQLSAIETLTADLQTQVTRTKRDLAALFAERTPPTSTRAQDDDPTSPTTPSSSPTQQHLRTTTRTTTDPSHLHSLTLQHQRETKQLTLKSAEYRSRIDALENHLAALTRSSPNSGPSSSTDPTVLAAKQRSLAAKKKRLDELHDRIRQFHGLPPDIEVSRAEVRRAEGDLDRLRRRRDDLFEAL